MFLTKIPGISYELTLQASVCVREESKLEKLAVWDDICGSH